MTLVSRRRIVRHFLCGPCCAYPPSVQPDWREFGRRTRTSALDLATARLAHTGSSKGYLNVGLLKEQQGGHHGSSPRRLRPARPTSRGTNHRISRQVLLEQALELGRLLASVMVLDHMPTAGFTHRC
jgi:hypothetical protein